MIKIEQIIKLNKTKDLKIQSFSYKLFAISQNNIEYILYILQNK